MNEERRGWWAWFSIFVSLGSAFRLWRVQGKKFIPGISHTGEITTIRFFAHVKTRWPPPASPMFHCACGGRCHGCQRKSFVHAAFPWQVREASGPCDYTSPAAGSMLMTTTSVTADPKFVIQNNTRAGTASLSRAIEWTFLDRVEVVFLKLALLVTCMHHAGARPRTMKAELAMRSPGIDCMGRTPFRGDLTLNESIPS